MQHFAAKKDGAGEWVTELAETFFHHHHKHETYTLAFITARRQSTSEQTLHDHQSLTQLVAFFSAKTGQQNGNEGLSLIKT